MKTTESIYNINGHWIKEIRIIEDDGKRYGYMWSLEGDKETVDRNREEAFDKMRRLREPYLYH